MKGLHNDQCHVQGKICTCVDGGGIPLNFNVKQGPYGRPWNCCIHCLLHLIESVQMLRTMTTIIPSARNVRDNDISQALVEPWRDNSTASRLIINIVLLLITGAIFHKDAVEVEVGFNYAIVSHKEAEGRETFELEATIDMIDVSNSYELTSASKSLLFSLTSDFSVFLFWFVLKINNCLKNISNW